MPPDHPDRCSKCSRQLVSPDPQPQHSTTTYQKNAQTRQPPRHLSGKSNHQTPHPSNTAPLTNNPRTRSSAPTSPTPSLPASSPPPPTPKTLKKIRPSTPKPTAYQKPTTSDSVYSPVCFGAKCPGPSPGLSSRRLINWRIRPSHG